MGHRRSTSGNFNPGGPNQRQRDLEEGWDSGLKRPLTSGDMWEDVEMVQPRDKTRSERPTELDDPFLAMGRMVKSAWKRVCQTQIQMSPPIPPNGSAGGDDDRPKMQVDVSQQLSSEIERKVVSEWEAQGQYSHGGNEKANHMASVKEDCVLGVLGSAPIRNSSFKIKKLRSTTEPFGKTTTVGSTFRGR